MPNEITRRELIAGATAGAAAMFVPLQPQRPTSPATATATVFSNAMVINPDAVQEDVSVAVQGDTIVAIGPNDAIARRYPNATTYDARNRAILPGLINCHAHLTATLERGFNEDFGFPNSARLSVRP